MFNNTLSIKSHIHLILEELNHKQIVKLLSYKKSIYTLSIYNRILNLLIYDTLNSNSTYFNIVAFKNIHYLFDFIDKYYCNVDNKYQVILINLISNLYNILKTSCSGVIDITVYLNSLTQLIMSKLQNNKIWGLIPNTLWVYDLNINCIMINIKQTIKLILETSFEIISLVYDNNRVASQIPKMYVRNNFKRILDRKKSPLVK